ncbi:primase-like DNA-binding domain-containing protein, partial [Staphylococcus aureus]|uniref:primase-like DNA-binding domain-containing protein n=1 Tax=Staphylococcus aureus TaxID=1280 RepID=UPI0021090FA4
SLENYELSEQKKASKTKEEYQFENKPVFHFIEEASDKDYRQFPVVEGCNTDKAYDIYQIWCVNNGYHHLNKFNFSNELAKIGYKTVSYYSSVEEKSKRFYKKDNTITLYAVDGSILKKLTESV